MKKCISTMLSLCLAVGLLSGMGAQKVQADTAVVYECENNDTKEVANSISGNEKVVGAITTGDVDFYKYTVSGAGIFSVNFSQYDYVTEDCYDIVIYDSNMNKINEETLVSSCTTKRVNFKKGTEFYIAVSASLEQYDCSQNGHYCLELNWTPKSNWEIESNDTKKTATQLNNKMVGTLYAEKDVDFYKYTAPKKGYVNFSFINEESLTDSPGWSVYIYDSSLKEIGSWKNVCANQVFGNVIVKKGTVLYIKVEKGLEGEGLGVEVLDKAYSITPILKTKTYLETEKNNSCSKANSIKLKKSYTGALNGNNDTDYYKIKATSTGTYKASLKLQKAVENGYSLVVYDSKKKEIKSATDIKENGKVKFKVKKGKTYYVQIKYYTSAWQSANQLYTLKVTK